MSELPERLQEIVEDFQLCVGDEKIEYLLHFSESLPPLPERLEEHRDEMELVHECQTPVFLHGEKRDGRLYYYYDVSPQSPTVRGYAAVLQEGLTGATADEVLTVPGDFHLHLGLNEVLSPQRLNGIDSMLAHMKRLAVQLQ